MIHYEYEFELDGKLHDVVVFGTCARDVLGHITCEVRKVMHDGVDIFSRVPQSQMAPMAARLWYSAISQRHPYGDGDFDLGA